MKTIAHIYSPGEDVEKAELHTDDERSVYIIFRVIAGLCDGQNQPLQVNFFVCLLFLRLSSCLLKTFQKRKVFGRVVLTFSELPETPARQPQVVQPGDGGDSVCVHHLQQHQWQHHRSALPRLPNPR